MISTVRIRRRVIGAAGAPSDLTHGELAFNEVENALYYGKGQLSKTGDRASEAVKVGGIGAFVALTGNQTVAGNKTFTGTTSLGTATGVTVGTADNSTNLATTAFVKAQNYGDGHSIHADVRNQSGLTIPKGSVVYISGATGQTPLISLAQANNYATADAIGVTATAISNNAFGQVMVFGLLDDFDTSGFTEGQSLYLSASAAGQLTTIEPVAPNFTIQIGWCQYQHAIHGKVLVHPNMESTRSTYIADSSAIGRSLLTAATASSARTTLELGDMATQQSTAVSITGGSINTIILDGGNF